MYLLSNWLLADGIFILEISAPIKCEVCPIFYQILMDYSRSKTNRGRGGVENMEFLGVLKKKHVEVLQGSIKKKVKFPEVLKKN